MVGDLEKALEDCNRALTMRPAYSNALDSRALVHLKMGKLDNAIADYTSALEVQQKNASSLYGRGVANAKKGDEKAARADIEAAKAIDPDIEEDFKRYGVH